MRRPSGAIGGPMGQIWLRAEFQRTFGRGELAAHGKKHRSLASRYFLYRREMRCERTQDTLPCDKRRISSGSAAAQAARIITGACHQLAPTPQTEQPIRDSLRDGLITTSIDRKSTRL